MKEKDKLPTVEQKIKDIRRAGIELDQPAYFHRKKEIRKVTFTKKGDKIIKKVEIKIEDEIVAEG